MCWENKCFSFENYLDKKVLVFICGPGYLEYPWAIETISRLYTAGAKVEVVDLSEVAAVYAMRLKYGPVTLPAISRTLIRNIVFSRKSRIEIVTRKICTEFKIPYKKHRLYFHGMSIRKTKKIAKFTGTYWATLSAREIIRSVFSTYERRALTDDDVIDLRKAKKIKSAILKTSRLIQVYKKPGFDAAFVANGRQPVQAAVVLELRDTKISVIKYESGGGYIFPNILKKRLDYYYTSPANSLETQEKILCKNLIMPKNSAIAEEELVELIKSRIFIPFVLNYLENSIDFIPEKKSTGRNYAFFTTSGWETSVIEISPEYKNRHTTFLDQIEAIKCVISNLEENDKLFLRLHPIDPGIHSKEEEVWKDFRSMSNVQFIDSYSKIDSYKLATTMDANFVWTSFLGFELALKKIPVAVLGDAVYAPLFNENWLRAPDKLKFWMNNPGLCSDKDLIKYIRYLAVGGFEIKSSETDISRRVKIDNAKLDSPKLIFTKLPLKLFNKIS
jgi:hypothetical protein